MIRQEKGGIKIGTYRRKNRVYDSEDLYQDTARRNLFTLTILATKRLRSIQYRRYSRVQAHSPHCTSRKRIKQVAKNKIANSAVGSVRERTDHPGSHRSSSCRRISARIKCDPILNRITDQRRKYPSKEDSVIKANRDNRITPWNVESQLINMISELHSSITYSQRWRKIIEGNTNRSIIEEIRSATKNYEPRRDQKRYVTMLTDHQDIVHTLVLTSSRNATSDSISIVHFSHSGVNTLPRKRRTEETTFIAGAYTTANLPQVTTI
jgi:hypothetical protein